MENKKSLYREYRPKNFDQVAGHEGIKEILISQIKLNSFGHALLFSGQRGTGKTSVAKIFSKIVNCQNLNGYNPCDKCLSCNEFNNNAHADIFEIDAASNNGVEEIRNIKANVSLMPNFSKYKVYIIDEVHMLSNSAFNALLKTLEEPPRHVIFVLATTEFSKIPSTIISRCQLFNFKRIDQKSLENKISEICNAEGKQITKEALNEIYYISDGSLRDALNYLEQSLIISVNEVSTEVLKKIFYISTKNEKINIIKNVIEGNSKEIIDYFEISNNQGIDFQTMTLSLLDILKEIIEIKLTGDYQFLVNLTQNDFEYFKDKKIELLFNLSDNIADSYTKSKNSNISFQYILINILKTISNNKLISLIKKDNNLSKNKINFVNKVESSKKANHMEEVRNNIQEFFNSEDDSKFLKLQMKLLISESYLYKKNINFSNDQIINVLVGANKQIRSYYDEKFSLILSEESINQNSEFIENFIMFFGSKITAASNDSIILVCEERTISKWINNRMQNEKIRDSVFKYFEREIKIISIDKKRWAEIKIDFMERKQNNNLESYKEIDVKDFYDNLISETDEKENEYLKRAKELLGSKNIKVVN
ncbi:DNA polymerase III subunit gamma/tau [Spiroplasma endosymbiont of Atherix ibis]|uniref:DNA polymerase III subunit gamma/tau n=1 Tax=Spiroplasma endosymbiont of Atherix ibis TaxID=3066291 RepID=UPI0030CFDCE0